MARSITSNLGGIPNPSSDPINNGHAHDTAAKRANDKNLAFVKNPKGSADSVDMNKWFHDARALEGKFDDLIAKLDALIFELDCILGSVSVDDAAKKLAAECRNHSKQMSSAKQSLYGIRGAINGAFHVCDQLSPGPEKNRLFACAKAADEALNFFLMQSTPPIIRSLEGRKHSGQSTNLRRKEESDDTSIAVSGETLTESLPPEDSSIVVDEVDSSDSSGGSWDADFDSSTSSAEGCADD